MTKWLLGTGAWILAGFLVLTIALIFSAREESTGFPSTTNFRASGYSAFFELLQRDGYEVRLEREVRPEYKPSDVILAITRPRRDEVDFGFGPPPSEARIDQFQEHLESGGKVIEIINWGQFVRASKEAQGTRLVQSAADPSKSYLLTLPTNPIEKTTLDVLDSPYGGWLIGDSSFVDYTKVGDGLLVTVGEGLPATNRFLDQADNARFMLDLVRSVAPAGASLVFEESGIGNVEQATVANTLGDWAVVARWQAIILFAVLVYTLSRRFGLPEIERRKVRSSRELFDAIADVFRRTGNTGLALDNLLFESDQRIRTLLNLSPSTKRSEMLQAAPQELRDRYLAVQQLAAANAPSRESIRQAKLLLKAIDAFELDSRAARGLQRL